MKILVTGGASGLGAAITRRLASAPERQIYFSYCRSADKAAALQAEYPNVQGICCDFRDSSGLAAFIARLGELDLDVLVNNAWTNGVEMQHFHKLPTAVFVRRFHDDLLPIIGITQEAIRTFRKKKFGKIINVLTAYLINRPPAGASEYVAAKAYLAALSKSWAVENASFNISSNSISPSFMRTGMTADTDERLIEEMETRSPARRLLRVEEAAAAVEYLVSASQLVNGTNLILNGGADVI